jgi:hypothetical protein
MGGRGPARLGELECVNRDVDCVLERARGAAGDGRASGDGQEVDLLRVKSNKNVRGGAGERGRR